MAVCVLEAQGKLSNHAGDVGFLPDACALVEVEAIDIAGFCRRIVGGNVEILVVLRDDEARNFFAVVASQRGSGGEIAFRENAVGIKRVARRVVHEVGARDAHDL